MSARDIIAEAFWPYSFSMYYEAYLDWQDASKEGRKNLLEAADEIIAALEANGYKVTPPSEVEKEPR